VKRRQFLDSFHLVIDSVTETDVSLGDRLRRERHAPGFDWSKLFYQYANRLAHGYWLEKLNGIPTRLVFLYLIGAADVDGPSTRDEWESAVHTVHRALGLATVPAFVVDAFVDVPEPLTLV
jgi:hypothetical protein